MLKKIMSIGMTLVLSLSIVGCSLNKSSDKNGDFDFIKEGKTNQIVIQSTRDKGFKFVVTSDDAIKQVYDILDSAKEVKKKSELEPDYIFEIYEKGGKVHKFNYIAGLDKQDGANLYNDENNYIVSARLDNDILRHFSNINKPKAFEEVYYDSIIKAMKEDFKKSAESGEEVGSIGVDLSEDLTVSKFMLSTDLQNFNDKLKKTFGDAELKQDGKEYHTIVHVATEGYKTNVYKSIISISKDKSKKDHKYYVWAKNEFGAWEINITEEEPKDF